MTEGNFQLAQKLVKDRYDNQSHLYSYHNWLHTEDMMSSIEDLVKESEKNGITISSKEKNLLKVAALVHDAGHTLITKDYSIDNKNLESELAIIRNLYSRHEENSIMILNRLGACGYSQNFIDNVYSIIRATKIIPVKDGEKVIGLSQSVDGKSHYSHLMKILCDADLANLGRVVDVDEKGRLGCFRNSDLVRKEEENLLGKTYTDLEWYKKSLFLMATSSYYTPEAKKLWLPGRTGNTETLKKKISEEEKVA